MSQELKVAIIDDDRLSSHNWNILLKFVGEDPFMLTGESWQRELTKSEDNTILAVLVGSLMESRFNDNAIVELVEAIHAWDNEVPIFLNYQKNALENLPETNGRTIFELPDQSDYQSLLNVLEQARKARGLDSASLDSGLISDTGTAMFRSLVGESEVMQHTRELMHRVADKNVNVLVLGESGTGKEIMARNLHYHSGRGENAFVIVNCSYISNELFGHDAGFNGNLELQAGLFEIADEGTIFFDEISDMSLETQARLLRFLETRSFERLGGKESIRADVRVIAATNKNLLEEIAVGMFREDLYYRLSVVPINLPALRDHAEDIPDLISEIISRLTHESNHSVRFNSSAIDSLQFHFWPGNVRELANLVERLSIIQVNEVVGMSDLPLEYQHNEKQVQQNTNSSRRNIGNEDSRFLSRDLQALEAEVARMKGSGNMPANEEPRAMAQGLPVLNEGEGKPLVATSSEGSESSAPRHQFESLEAEPSNIQAPKARTLQSMNVDELKVYMKNFEKHLIQVALDDSAGIVNFAAERLMIDEQDLEEKMKEHDIEPSS